MLQKCGLRGISLCPSGDATPLERAGALTRLRRGRRTPGGRRGQSGCDGRGSGKAPIRLRGHGNSDPQRFADPLAALAGRIDGAANAFRAMAHATLMQRRPSSARRGLPQGRGDQPLRPCLSDPNDRTAARHPVAEAAKIVDLLVAHLDQHLRRPGAAPAHRAKQHHRLVHRQLPQAFRA